MDDLMKTDIYEFLGVTESATESEVKKAFRVKALTCHPDKNPDDPKAAELFHRYSRAAEVLLDSAARHAYDKLVKSRKERLARNKGLDGSRKRLKEELEARERASHDDKDREADQSEKLVQEIERMRKQGFKQLEEENERLKQQILSERLSGHQTSRPADSQHKDARIKVSWKGTDRVVDPSRVKSLFQRFGPVSEFIMSSKGTSALIVYQESDSVLRATASAMTAGFVIQPLSPVTVTKASTFSSLQKQRSDNYEELVLQKLRQKAEEQKKVQT